MRDKSISDDQIVDIVKKKQGRSDIGMLVDPPVDPSDVSRYVRLAMTSWDLPPIDISDPKQVEDRIRLYFDHCVENGRKPQIVGMANWLGIDRSTLNSWKRGEYRGATHSPIIQAAINAIEEMWIDFMQNGKVNPAAGIFLAKNFFQYADTQQVVVTPNNPYQGATEDELKQKYLSDIATDGDETDE